MPERVIKKATKRNRLRRLLREAVRHWWSDILPGHDVILVANGAPKHDHAGFVEGIFLQLLLRAGLLSVEGQGRATARLERLSAEFDIPSGGNPGR